MNVRHLPRWQIAQRLKRRGLTQHDIAQRAKVTQGYVSNVIARRARPSEQSAEVWRVLEEVLG